MTQEELKEKLNQINNLIVGVCESLGKLEAKVDAVLSRIGTATEANSKVGKIPSQPTNKVELSQSEQNYIRKVFETPAEDLKDLTRKIGAIHRKGINTSWLLEHPEEAKLSFETKFGPEAQVKSTVKFIQANNQSQSVGNVAPSNSASGFKTGGTVPFVNNLARNAAQIAKAGPLEDSDDIPMF